MPSFDPPLLTRPAQNPRFRVYTNSKGGVTSLLRLAAEGLVEIDPFLRQDAKDKILKALRDGKRTCAIHVPVTILPAFWVRPLHYNTLLVLSSSTVQETSTCSSFALPFPFPLNFFPLPHFPRNALIKPKKQKIQHQRVTLKLPFFPQKNSPSHPQDLPPSVQDQHGLAHACAIGEREAQHYPCHSAVLASVPVFRLDLLGALSKREAIDVDDERESESDGRESESDEDAAYTDDDEAAGAGAAGAGAGAEGAEGEKRKRGRRKKGADPMGEYEMEWAKETQIRDKLFR